MSAAIDVAAEAKVKGTGIRAMLRFAETKGGPEGLKRVLARLTEDDRRIVAAGILPSSRYSEDFDHRILLAVCAEYFSRDIDGAADVGKAVLDEGMNIFSRLFLKFGDPAFLISKAGSLWNQYHTVGKLEIYDVTPKSARGRLTDYPWNDLQFCRVFSGAIIRALEVSGCKGITITHEKCIGRRDGFCQYQLKWD